MWALFPFLYIVFVQFTIIYLVCILYEKHIPLDVSITCAGVGTRSRKGDSRAGGYITQEPNAPNDFANCTMDLPNDNIFKEKTYKLVCLGLYIIQNSKFYSATYVKLI